MNRHRSLLGFGLISLGVSFSLTLLIVATGVTLLLAHLESGRDIWPVLMFTCLVGGLCCLLLSALQFVQLSFKQRTESGVQQREQRWSEDLLAWLYMNVPLSRPLDQTGAETLLKLRDSMRGEASDQLQVLYAREGWLARDLAALARPQLPVVVRAETIERLALLRDSAALGALSRELIHPRQEIRALALLALSRSIGRLELERAERMMHILALHGAIAQGQFSVGQVQEALTLLGDAGSLLARDLLTSGSDSLRVATLDVLARQRNPGLHSDVVRLLNAPNAELRAGALRVLSRTGRVPASAAPTVLALTYDPTSFVRLQATKAAAYAVPLPQDRLWKLLGDSHWWVRRAAAQGLLGTADGEALLARAREFHLDRYARDTASAALQEQADLRQGNPERDDLRARTPVAPHTPS